MARLRASWRTSLPVVQQPRNPQSESIARSPYDFLVQRDPPLPPPNPGRPLGSGARKGSGPPRRLRVDGRAGTGRQAPQPRMGPGQPSLNRLAQVDQHMSGSRAPLPEPSPLRTGRDDCSSSGSSLGRLAPDPRVVPMMTPPVYQLQVVHPVRSATVTRRVVVFVDERNVLIRVEPHTTHRASVVLPFQQHQALWRAERLIQTPTSPRLPVAPVVGVQRAPLPLDLGMPRDGHVVVSCEPCPTVHEAPRAVEVSRPDPRRRLCGVSTLRPPPQLRADVVVRHVECVF